MTPPAQSETLLREALVKARAQIYFLNTSLPIIAEIDAALQSIPEPLSIMVSCQLERLAEHLAARPIPQGGGDIEAVADWLDYSLNKCGLVVIKEQALAQSEPLSDEGLVERVRTAIARELDCDTSPYERLTNAAQAAIRAALSIPRLEAGRVTEAMVKHMANRFLGWRLPENFNPDDGISFEPVANKGTQYEHRHTPTGTNLFDANQADAMVRYMIEGLPAAPKKISLSHEWNDGRRGYGVQCKLCGAIQSVGIGSGGKRTGSVFEDCPAKLRQSSTSTPDGEDQ